MSPDSPRPNAPAIASLSVEEAAAAIVALINSRVQSPRQDELEAIVRRVGQLPQQRRARFEQIRRLNERAAAVDKEYHALPEGEERDRLLDNEDALELEIEALCRATWAQPVRQPLPDEVRERAQIALRWHRMRADDWEEPSDCDDWGDRCIAEFIDAVLQAPAAEAQP
jgi:hypothetical protein